MPWTIANICHNQSTEVLYCHQSSHHIQDTQQCFPHSQAPSHTRHTAVLPSFSSPFPLIGSIIFDLLSSLALFHWFGFCFSFSPSLFFLDSLFFFSCFPISLSFFFSSPFLLPFVLILPQMACLHVRNAHSFMIEISFLFANFLVFGGNTSKYYH